VKSCSDFVVRSELIARQRCRSGAFAAPGAGVARARRWRDPTVRFPALLRVVHSRRSLPGCQAQRHIYGRPPSLLSTVPPIETVKVLRPLVRQIFKPSHRRQDDRLLVRTARPISLNVPSSADAITTSHTPRTRPLRQFTHPGRQYDEIPVARPITPRDAPRSARDCPLHPRRCLHKPVRPRNDIASRPPAGCHLPPIFLSSSLHRLVSRTDDATYTARRKDPVMKEATHPNKEGAPKNATPSRLYSARSLNSDDRRSPEGTVGSLTRLR